MQVRAGVYALGGMAQSASLSERQRLIDRAACLRITVPFVRSHTTAALELGMPILLPRSPQTHVTRTPVVGTQSRYGVKHHLAPFPPEQVTMANGLPALGLARTAIDIAREYGRPYGVVAVDSARRMGVAVDELWGVLDGMRSWPHRRRAIEAVEQSAEGSESVGESLLRDLLEELGIGPAETQFGLTDGQRTAFADLRVGRHLFEFDGRLKYRMAEGGGISLRAVDDVLWDEKTRQDFLTGFKLGMSRVVWDDLFGRRREQLKVRLRREFDDTGRRFGNDIADLAPFVVRRRRSAA